MRSRFKPIPVFLILILSIVGYAITNPLRTKRLTRKEKRSIPYEGKEVLIFRSNKYELDTIRIREITVRKHPPPLNDMFWARNKEILRVHQDVDCKNCDAIITYSVQNFSAKTKISYHIRMHGKEYYHGTYFKKLDDLKLNTITIDGAELNDVVFIDRNFEKYHPGHIDRLYWSRSKGIVRFDVNPDYYWELINQ